MFSISSSLIIFVCVCVSLKLVYFKWPVEPGWSRSLDLNNHRTSIAQQTWINGRCHQAVA